MGGQNLNKYIRNIVKIKIILVLGLAILFLGSMIIDLSLFFEEKSLKSDLEACSNKTDKAVVNAFLEECDYYKENYQDINIDNIEKQLEILNSLEYHELKFESDRTIIKISKTSSESLQKTVEYLRNSGYEVVLDTVEKEGNAQYVEMEVKTHE